MWHVRMNFMDLCLAAALLLMQLVDISKLECIRGSIIDGPVSKQALLNLKYQICFACFFSNQFHSNHIGKRYGHNIKVNVLITPKLVKQRLYPLECLCSY